MDGDGPIRPGRDCFGEQCFAISALQCKPDREGRPAELKAYAELRGCEVISQISLDDIVLNMLLRTRQNIHIPEDSGETELILILKIAAVTPLKNENGQKVVSILQKICNVELSGVMGDLAVTYIGSVEPYVEAGVNALEVEIGARSGGIPMPLKAVQIGPAGIVLGDVGRIEGKGIADVSVLIAVIPAHLPAERHLLFSPPLAGLIVRQIKMILQVMDAGIIGEAPWTSAQHLQAVGTLSVPGQHIIAGGAGDKVGPVRHGILVENREVLI